ncbi:MAG: LolA family protein [Vicinamibacteraceae bacterium]
MPKLIKSITLLALLCLWSSNGAAQTVDELVRKNLAAVGGEAAWRRVDALQSNGTMTGPKGQKAELTLWTKRPNLRRQDVRIEGQTITNAFDGKELWVRHPRMGDQPQLVTGEAAESAKAEASFDPPFLDYEKRDIEIEQQGTVEVDGKKAHKLKLSYPEGTSPVLYLDEATGLILRVVIQAEVQGKEIVREERLSDWRKVDGIMLPFRTETLMNGRPMTTITLSSVKINPSVDDSFFQMESADQEGER